LNINTFGDGGNNIGQSNQDRGAEYVNYANGGIHIEENIQIASENIGDDGASVSNNIPSANIRSNEAFVQRKNVNGGNAKENVDDGIPLDPLGAGGHNIGQSNLDRAQEYINNHENGGINNAQTNQNRTFNINSFGDGGNNIGKNNQDGAPEHINNHENGDINMEQNIQIASEKIGDDGAVFNNIPGADDRNNNVIGQRKNGNGGNAEDNAGGGITLDSTNNGNHIHEYYYDKSQINTEDNSIDAVPHQ